MAEPAATSVPIVYPLRGLERVDRRVVNQALCPAEPRPAGDDRAGRGMTLSVRVVLHAGDGTETVVREVFHLDRGPLTPDSLGLGLAEAKDLLAAVQREWEKLGEVVLSWGSSSGGRDPGRRC